MPRIQYIAATLVSAILITSTQPVHAYGRLFNPTVEANAASDVCIFSLADDEIDSLGMRIITDAKKVIADTIATGTLSATELQENATLPTSGSPAVLNWAHTYVPHRQPTEIAEGLRALYNYSTSDLSEIDYYYKFLGIKRIGNQKLKFTKAEAAQAQREFQTALTFINAELAAIAPTSPAYPLVAHENTVQTELFRSLLAAVANCIEGRSTVPTASTPSSSGTSARPKAGIIAGLVTAVTAFIAAIITFLPQIHQLITPRSS